MDLQVSLNPLKMLANSGVYCCCPISCLLLFHPFFDSKTTVIFRLNTYKTRFVFLQLVYCVILRIDLYLNEYLSLRIHHITASLICTLETSLQAPNHVPALQTQLHRRPNQPSSALHLKSTTRVPLEVEDLRPNQPRMNNLQRLPAPPQPHSVIIPAWLEFNWLWPEFSSSKRTWTSLWGKRRKRATGSWRNFWQKSCWNWTL